MLTHGFHNNLRIARHCKCAEHLTLVNLTLLFGRFALRERQASKGQILILILLVLVGLVVIFGLLFTASIRVRAAPILQEAFWLVDNQRVSTTRLGENVEAHVVIKATEEYVGSIVVKIRKDIALWLDSNYLISTIPVNLKGGEEKEMKITFMPDEASTGSLRGYFVEIDFRVTRTTWVMENSYPPRLKVTD
jgi:hypothetical protein